jgi:hypothetical protein
MYNIVKIMVFYAKNLYTSFNRIIYKDNMGKRFCFECNKKLGFFEGYRHPILGKKDLLCSACFDIESEIVKKIADDIRINSTVKYPEKLDWSINWNESQILKKIQEIPDIIRSMLDIYK